MKQTAKQTFLLAGLLALLFTAFTALVASVDVQAIGPCQTSVGFSTVNRFVFQHIGVHLIWYHITDWLGVAAIACAFVFASIGLCQLLRRKHLQSVDRSLLVLGLFYILVLGCYLLFEQAVINHRPILLGSSPEASYPSSHTMIVVSIMATAPMQVRSLCPQKPKLYRLMGITSNLLIAVTVVGRFLSGVHWFTDIVGGLLLSAALVALYCAVIKQVGTSSSAVSPNKKGKS